MRLDNSGLLPGQCKFFCSLLLAVCRGQQLLVAAEPKNPRGDIFGPQKIHEFHLTISAEDYAAGHHYYLDLSLRENKFCFVPWDLTFSAFRKYGNT